MKIDLKLIAKTSFDGMNTMNHSDEISAGFRPNRQNSVLYGSSYDLDIVENLILGALVSYHQQLRDVLIEKGIDIGDLIT